MIFSRQEQFEQYFSVDEQGLYSIDYKLWKLSSCFQAIYDRHNKLVGYEALVRINQRNCNTPITPDVFFHTKSYDLQDRINVDRLARAMHIRNFAQSNKSHLKLFLNMLPASTESAPSNPSSVDLINRRLKELEISNQQLVMEIVEQHALNENRLVGAANHLREHGFGVAVDDYGSMASTAQRVAALQPDIVKIDRGLLKKYMQGNVEPLYHALQVAQQHASATVIEGIETPEQFSAMLALNIDYFQGYFLAKPKPLGLETVQVA
ncbi:EAL domain-containing protein [Vibrio sp. SCSIO 43136]|uniref:EAL domain-containing protein n=1 Tax=Vibrio sp. SCSIO 43136 TaxID=2819101 RepID=UPI002074EB00|nr:EAL domain-containing protein [Vibrio sp. SCSIO 43136]USD68196.1 EAL domain-containing protein [Vibrio sp. SCSIO 43136]